MKPKQGTSGILVPTLPLGGLRRVRPSDWRKDLLVSWLFQTCIRLQTSLNRRFLRFGMTVQDASVLLRCVEARQWSPGKLSVVLGRDKAMVTRFVHRLEAAHLITRERNRRDRRLSIIRPTGKGKRLAQDLASVLTRSVKSSSLGHRKVTFGVWANYSRNYTKMRHGWHTCPSTIRSVDELEAAEQNRLSCQLSPSAAVSVWRLFLTSAQDEIQFSQLVGFFAYGAVLHAK
jgi:DNA-binding MarR family transcriptional regulator